MIGIVARGGVLLGIKTGIFKSLREIKHDYIDLESFTLLLERRLNSLIIPLRHPCSVLLLNKTSMSIAQKTHHTLAGIQLSHNNIEWGEGGLNMFFTAFNFISP